MEIHELSSQKYIYKRIELLKKDLLGEETWTLYMSVSKNRGTPKFIHFDRVFHYKPSILGGFPPIFLETPIYVLVVFNLTYHHPFILPWYFPFGKAALMEWNQLSQVLEACQRHSRAAGGYVGEGLPTKLNPKSSRWWFESFFFSSLPGEMIQIID